jgi:hypothetical protein
MLKVTKQTERKIGAILQRHQEALLRKSNVIGIGIGEKVSNGQNTGRAALVTFVERKLPMSELAVTDVVPPVIERVTTDVIEIGKPVIHSNTMRLRPAIAGISISHFEGTAGTFGCLLRNEGDGRVYVLSNNHVIANSNNGRFGDSIVQPGMADGGSNPNDRIATLYRYPEVMQSGSNLVDCAVAQPASAEDVQVGMLNAWTDIKLISGLSGVRNQSGDVGLADISGNGQQDLVVFYINNPENHGYYRIGWDLDINGNVTGGWSDIKPIPGWFSTKDQGAIALADITGNGRPDLIVFHVGNHGGENHGYYRIGWDLDINGNVRGWSDIKVVPDWFCTKNRGGSIAVADIDGNGRPELFILHFSDVGRENQGYYSIGWNVDINGNVTRGWSNPTRIPGGFGMETHGCGIALADFTGTDRPDLVVYYSVNLGGENICYYDKARECISRLKANEIWALNTKAYGKSGAISLIQNYTTVNDLDGKPTQYRVWINPNLIVLFAGNTFTSHTWNTYRKLSPVARRMADYIESHKHPFPLNLIKFRQMCSSADASLTSWRQTVRKACAEIEVAEIAKRAMLNKDDLICCIRE